MASYDHKGTKITGTSTTAKIFKKSGISNAKRNDTYFNTSTGHVYRCDTAGSASKAKWAYVRTDIASKPTKTVAGLGAPKRITSGSNTRLMKAEWSVPSSLTNNKNGDRATGLEIQWSLGIKGKDPKKVIETSNESKTSSTINLNSFTVGRKTYSRSDFYPFEGKPKLTYVTTKIKATNSKGDGPAVKETREFSPPVKPTIGDFSFNTETGTVSTTIKADAGTGYRERYDTRYKVSVYNSATGQEWNSTNSTTQSTEFPASYDVAGYQSISYDQYYRITVTAWSRGYAGNSEVAKKVYYVGYPAKASINKVVVSGKDSSSKCTVYIKTNSSTAHPVDRVKLETLTDVEYATAAQIPANPGWDDAGIIDDAECTALAVPVADLIPSAGNYTWLRVKTYHANEEILCRYSDYYRVRALETPVPTAADDDIVIISIEAGEDGESALVQLAWNADGQDDSTGTELSWADSEDTWRSTENPKEHTFTWTDGSFTGTDPITGLVTTYHDSALITVKGLEEGTKYYFKARRYLDADETTYSAYSNTGTVLTSETPETIVASCDKYVPVGASLPIYWTLSGNGIQTSWQIVTSAGTVILEGEGITGSAQISADRLAEFATNGSITFTVQASTGADYVISEAHTVRIVNAPELEITSAATLTAQSVSFTATTDRLCDLTIILTSQGASTQGPTGIQRQPSGDTIYSDVYEPLWTEGSDSFSATVELPGGLDLWNLATYTLSVVATDRDTGLQSEPQKTDITIDWANPAVDPYDHIELTAVDTYDENEGHILGVQISLTAPETANEDDVYDIYRLDGGHASLIGESFPLTHTVIDRYAPFGDNMTLYYRVALRTVDGDVAFADIEYVLDNASLRFDWEDGYVELPYNISIGDSYRKDFELRQHMDGSSDGYWNPNIERSSSLSTDVIRITQESDIEMTRKLARYSGPVFVRTPIGSAYEADVQVSDMSVDNSAIMAVAIDATEIGLTQEFILPNPFPLVEEGE